MLASSEKTLVVPFIKNKAKLIFGKQVVHCYAKLVLDPLRDPCSCSAKLSKLQILAPYLLLLGLRAPLLLPNTLTPKKSIAGQSSCLNPSGPRTARTGRLEPERSSGGYDGRAGGSIKQLSCPPTGSKSTSKKELRSIIRHQSYRNVAYLSPTRNEVPVTPEGATFASQK